MKLRVLEVKGTHRTINTSDCSVNSILKPFRDPLLIVSTWLPFDGSHKVLT